MSNLYFSLIGHLDVPVSFNPDVRPWVDPGSGRHQRGEFNHRHCFLSLATGDPRKNLPFGLVQEVAAWLYQERGLVPVIACNPGQEHLQIDFEKHLSQAGIPCVCLDRVGLVELLQLMQSVRLSILPDTGLFHLAVAAGGPVLGIFTHTHPLHVDPFLDHVKIMFSEDLDAGADLHGLPYGSRQIDAHEVIDSLSALLDRTEAQERQYASVAS